MTRRERLYEEQAQSPWSRQPGSPPPSRRHLDAAAQVMTRLGRAGVDMDEVGRTLEAQGMAAFREPLTHVLGALEAKAHGRPA